MDDVDVPFLLLTLERLCSILSPKSSVINLIIETYKLPKCWPYYSDAPSVVMLRHARNVWSLNVSMKRLILTEFDEIMFVPY